MLYQDTLLQKHALYGIVLPFHGKVYKLIEDAFTHTYPNPQPPSSPPHTKGASHAR